MVNLVLAGMVPSEVSKYCRESTNTITGWVKIVDEQGFEALRIKKYPGRAPKLNAQQLEEIKQTILEDRPEDHGYYVWDGPSLSDYIKKKHDITYTVRHCQRLLRSLGFSLVRPQPYPSKGEENEVAREDFKKKIAALRADPCVKLFYQDEVHFQLQTSITRKWVAKGSCPKVKSPPGKVSICYSGFVSPEDGTLFVTKPTWFTYETVIESFRQFVAACPLSEGKKICLVLDNAPWHKKACRLIENSQPDKGRDRCRIR